MNGIPFYHADVTYTRHLAEGTLPSVGNWLPDTSSGVSALDKWQHDFLTALNDTSRSEDQEFCSRYGVFVSKAECAFRQEELWMEEIDFPMLKICQEQHARVLGALHNVHFHVMDGDLGLGREVVDQLLPRWFAFHTSTVCTVLALAMQIAHTEKAPLADETSGRYGNFPLTS